MTPEEHASLTTTVRQIILMEKQSTGLSNQISALRRDGVPDLAIRGSREALNLIRSDVKRWKRQLAKEWKGLPVVEWSKTVHGLGDAVVLTLGTVPRLTDFPNVAKLWKYGGFAPDQGPKKGQNHKYSREFKSFTIKRLADPCMKQRLSPYRAVYDGRRAHTVLSHPDWTDGHLHNDALRITAKAILRDLWLVANDKSPRVGQTKLETHSSRARLSDKISPDARGHRLRGAHAQTASCVEEPAS